MRGALDEGEGHGFGSLPDRSRQRGGIFFPDLRNRTGNADRAD
jgi:hypothetical protein